jgi:hypothetical protein
MAAPVPELLASSPADFSVTRRPATFASVVVAKPIGV